MIKILNIIILAIILSLGKWHLIHHKHSKYNYGLFVPIWDILFKTYKSLTNDSKK